MKKVGIRSNITKKYEPTSSQKPMEELENLVSQDFTTEIINEMDGRYYVHSHTTR